ncbi:hypothetical protein EJ08DRAFT_701938 [Tothia fuscella]|uniref:RING-type domain-containing protein n=1 Tax=Tothia fuscella TaxID=1048955 RepID=A0A9P4NHS1_9PEZI|nr:hypothetical protein EJ08DRAFT_701938 [Tothia fuscella]
MRCPACRRRQNFRTPSPEPQTAVRAGNRQNAQGLIDALRIQARVQDNGQVLDRNNHVVWAINLDVDPRDFQLPAGFLTLMDVHEDAVNEDERNHAPGPSQITEGGDGPQRRPRRSSSTRPVTTTTGGARYDSAYVARILEILARDTNPGRLLHLLALRRHGQLEHDRQEFPAPEATLNPRHLTFEGGTMRERELYLNTFAPQALERRLPNERNCFICLQPFDNDRHQPFPLPCGHHFGYPCVRTWLLQENGDGHNCPRGCLIFGQDVGRTANNGVMVADSEDRDLRRLRAIIAYLRDVGDVSSEDDDDNDDDFDDDDDDDFDDDDDDDFDDDDDDDFDDASSGDDDNDDDDHSGPSAHHPGPNGVADAATRPGGLSSLSPVYNPNSPPPLVSSYIPLGDRNRTRPSRWDAPGNSADRSTRPANNRTASRRQSSFSPSRSRTSPPCRSPTQASYSRTSPPYAPTSPTYASYSRTTPPRRSHPRNVRISPVYAPTSPTYASHSGTTPPRRSPPFNSGISPPFAPTSSTYASYSRTTPPRRSPPRNGRTSPVYAPTSPTQPLSSRTTPPRRSPPRNHRTSPFYAPTSPTGPLSIHTTPPRRSPIRYSPTSPSYAPTSSNYGRPTTPPRRRPTSLRTALRENA